MAKDIYMTEKELRNQLEVMLNLKWHKKDIAILAEVLFSEYQNNINKTVVPKSSSFELAVNSSVVPFNLSLKRCM